ncbi:type IX secretion system outer membrane channel protein PorV [Bacteroidales bacterium OttesenSCG-928-I14]|nr:type IX secretion system outer membrane channel protein PorV [Bacteroidales bacterium OttesenSCG-928-I14]
MNRIKVILLALVLGLSTSVFADGGKKEDMFNPLVVGVPSLTIAPDARGGAMGDLGAATEADFASQYWNPAKYAFAYSKAGVGLNYTPWLRQLVNDIDLVYLSGFLKLGDYDRSAIGASIRYFSLGKIQLTPPDGVGSLGETSPYEMAFDVSYSLKFSETFAGAVALRGIYSDLGSGVADDDLYPGWGFAADVAGYYNNYVMLGASECMLGLGFNISNIGTKISYDKGNTNVFIPANLRLGASLLVPMDDYNAISFNVDVNKLLVPTPPDTEGMDSTEKTQAWEDYNNTSSIAGIFKSFGDAPGGAKEEFKEIMWSVGAEYSYDNQFFVRGGYFYENPYKGNRQYFSLGAGFKMSAFQLDVAYLISTVPSNPLDQTLRFSLSFDMDGLKGLIR